MLYINIMKYICLRCGFKASQRSNLENHLNRKNICDPIEDFISIDEVKKYYGFRTKSENEMICTQNAPFCTQTAPKMHLNDTFCENEDAPKMHLFAPKSKIGCTQNAPFCTQNEIKSHICKYCNKKFTRSTGLTKHLNVCKIKKEIDILRMNQNEEMKKMKKEIEELKNYKIQNENNTTNNTTNNNIINNCHYTTTNNHNDNSVNIHINNYGCENKDYITKDYLIKLLKTPFQAIPKLIEYTHFNKDHPENQNIKLPNKKQPYVKILKNDKWIYADRKATIMDLIDEKHCELNDTPLLKHIGENFSYGLQDRFKRFNDRYLNDEKDLTNQLYKETELVMINNS